MLLEYENTSHDFKFDRCFDQDCNQDKVFEEVPPPLSRCAIHPTDHVSATKTTAPRFSRTPLRPEPSAFTQVAHRENAKCDLSFPFP